MILHIVRHPKSYPESDTVQDEQRQVTNRGAKQFTGTLKLFDKADEMSPDVIFCGPETRNMQAAELARDFFNLDTSDVVQSANLGPGGDPKALLGEIQQWYQDNGDEDTEIMVIGSNPALAGFFQLAHGIGTKAGQSGAVKLKKGSVAKLKAYVGDDGKISGTELRSYVPPGLARGKK